MKKQSPELPVRKLVLEKKTIMKLNDGMMQRIVAGKHTTKTSTDETESCLSCSTFVDCDTSNC